LQNAQLHRYVNDQLYWVLHAPRQTGKTTFLLSWAKELNAAPSGEFAAAYVTVERVQGIAEPERAMPSICDAIRVGASDIGLPVPARPAADVAPTGMLDAIMRDWAELVAPRKLIVLFDEVDVMVGETLVSFLHQLRTGDSSHAIGVFPVSIALVSRRAMQDCIADAKYARPMNLAGPFNVKQDAASISNFTKENVVELFAQRTADTGQQIAPDALEYVWEQSAGQPWLVNSFFKRATMRVLDEKDYSTVTVEHLREARKQIIEARETHLDALGKRLQDPRVKRVVQCVLTGDKTDPLGDQDDDVEYVRDLGLIKKSPVMGYEIANPLYEEVLTRYLNSRYYNTTPPPQTFRWKHPDGSLDMDSLLREFQKFWRRNSEIWEVRADYPEAFPHLLLQAFLQRLTNGGGRIERESASGTGRMDLLIEYEGKQNIIEIKILHDYDTPAGVREEGVEQVLKYRDRIARNAPCYLVVFNRRSDVKIIPWETRLTWEVINKTKQKRTDEVTIVGC